MKALVFYKVGDIRLEHVPEPKLKNDHDVIVKLTRSAICGTDLHSVRGTIANTLKGTILGHEGVGIVEQLGARVEKFKIGDRVIVPSTISCGYCEYCRKEIYSQCDNANPQGPDAGTPYYGGPKDSGPFQGMQTQKVRVPYADASLIAIPDSIVDDQVILLSDILPTAYMAVEMADIQPDDTVAIFGCGPVGQLILFCVNQLKPAAVFAIDRIPFRLQKAAAQGAITINFDTHDPYTELKKSTSNKGPTKIIDAVGIDADHPHYSFFSSLKHHAWLKEFKKEVKTVAPRINPHHGNWIPGNAPSQALQWAVRSVAKAGTISIIGVYTELLKTFPIGEAMGKNLILRMGNCNHRKYIPRLLEWVQNSIFDSRDFYSHKLPFDEIVTGYKQFDKRADGWMKVILTLD